MNNRSAQTRYRMPFRPIPVLEFLAMADIQDDGERSRWRDVVDTAWRDHHDVSAVWVVGDMAVTDNPGTWWTFFDRGRTLWAHIPMVTVPGNHDTPDEGSNPDTSSHRRYFPPADPAQSSSHALLRIGPVLVLALDTEHPTEMAPGGEQDRFVETTLRQAESSADRPDWIFALWHVPPYNAGARHAGQVGVSRDLTAHFDGVVDWVFGGHEHLYQRHVPLRYNAIIAPSGAYGVDTPDKGVGYMVLPPAGAMPEIGLVSPDGEMGRYLDRLAFPDPTDRANLTPEQGYVHVRIEGREITLTAYGIGGRDQPHASRRLDHVTYRKP